MKKFLLAILVFVAVGFTAFAEKKAAYTVVSVTGKVTYEVSNGEWAELKKGMLLDEAANISVAMNSTLVLEKDGVQYPVKAMKKGAVASLTANSSAGAGVKMGKRVTKEVIAEASSNKETTVTTASSRASEAKADVEWDE